MTIMFEILLRFFRHRGSLFLSLFIGLLPRRIALPDRIFYLRGIDCRNRRTIFVFGRKPNRQDDTEHYHDTYQYVQRIEFLLSCWWRYWSAWCWCLPFTCRRLTSMKGGVVTIRIKSFCSASLFQVLKYLTDCLRTLGPIGCHHPVYQIAA